LDCTVLIALRLISINNAESAPLLKASIPTLPVPANISKNVEFVISGPMMLNKDSFTRSVIGRVISPGTEPNLRPFALPEITRITQPATEVSRSPNSFSLNCRGNHPSTLWRAAIMFPRGTMVGITQPVPKIKPRPPVCWIASSASTFTCPGVPKTIVS